MHDGHETLAIVALALEWSLAEQRFRSFSRQVEPNPLTLTPTPTLL